MKLVKTTISQVNFGAETVMVRHPCSWGEPKKHNDVFKCSNSEKLIEFTEQEGVFKCKESKDGVYNAVYQQTFKEFTGSVPVRILKD